MSLYRIIVKLYDILFYGTIITRLQKAVATTFHDIVLDETKHVLIEFYSPYCGHCKQFIPVYNELASRAREDSNVVIAKMDAVSNSLPRPFESRGLVVLLLDLKTKQQAKWLTLMLWPARLIALGF